MTKVMIEGFGWIYLVVVLDWHTEKVVGHYAGLQARAWHWLVALNGEAAEVVSASGGGPLRNGTMTAEVDANELRDAVERLHGCPAQLVEAVPVSSPLRGGRSGTASSISSTLRGIGRPTDATLGRRGSRERPAPPLCCPPHAADCLAG